MVDGVFSGSATGPAGSVGGPLAGYIALDISQMIAGPVGATLLATAGMPPLALPYTVDPSDAGCAMLRRGGADLSLCGDNTRSTV